jgi:starch synthase
MKVLHAAAELFPWVKVGGLGDVLGALPQAQRAIGVRARLLLPAYPALKQAFPGAEPVAVMEDLLGSGPARFLLARTPEAVPLYLLDAPSLFERPGGPYEETGDSYLRFGALSFAAAWLAKHGDSHGWRARVLHCHDWQTGLAPAYLALWGGVRPASLMTVHNLAYQGIYGREVLARLALPPEAFQIAGVEYHGNVSFLKGGLHFADRLSTVSPTYALEIQSPAFGEGLDGLLAHRKRDLMGILNGVDGRIWNPASSPHLATHFDANHRSGKKVCKNLLQRELHLSEEPGAPLFAVVSRLATQKGLDLVLANVDHLVSLGGQLALLGSGDPALEQAFKAAAHRHRSRVAVRIGYDEALAHRILGGADALMVPSRFEPCGLTQLYALRYGALPVVRRTGGLADTVVDTRAESLADGTATGFAFDPVDGWVLGETLTRACELYFRQPRDWAHVQQNAMKQDFSWRASAKRYADLYQELVG